MLGTWANLVDCYIALSEFARSRMASSGIPAHKIHVKPNFVTPDPGMRTRVGDHAIFLSRLVVEKGPLTLIKAWKGINGRVPLHIYGDGPLRTKLETICQSEGIKNVHIHGLVPRSQVLEQIRSARFLIFPSESYENFPMAIVESLACGVPVIASNIGSTAEIVRDGISGLTFAPGNAMDLLDRVEWAISHPNRLQEMGRGARSEFEAKYSATRNYEMLMRIYKTALGEATATEPFAVPEVA